MEEDLFGQGLPSGEGMGNLVPFTLGWSRNHWMANGYGMVGVSVTTSGEHLAGYPRFRLFTGVAKRTLGH